MQFKKFERSTPSCSVFFIFLLLSTFHPFFYYIIVFCVLKLIMNLFFIVCLQGLKFLSFLNCLSINKCNVNISYICMFVVFKGALHLRKGVAKTPAILLLQSQNFLGDTSYIMLNLPVYIYKFIHGVYIINACTYQQNQIL